MVVWNPFMGQTRWIQHIDLDNTRYNYDHDLSLGLELGNASHSSVSL